ncbi:hypothetical protein EV174_001339 [Coemansia sp. RSA 2320]|nr:hypothetical protein EV174_001339 [Coemansia sp. RSA 2320]
MANQEQIERCAHLLSSRSTDDEKLAGLLLMPRVVDAQDSRSLAFIFDTMDVKFIERLMRTGIKQLAQQPSSSTAAAAAELPMLSIALSVIDVFGLHSSIAAKPLMLDRIPTLCKVATLADQANGLTESLQILCKLFAVDAAVQRGLEKPEPLLSVVDSACSRSDKLDTMRFVDFLLNRCSCYIHTHNVDLSCARGWSELVGRAAAAFESLKDLQKFELISVLANALEPIDRDDLEGAGIVDMCATIASNIGSSCIWILQQKSETTLYADQALVLYSHLVRLWPGHVFCDDSGMPTGQEPSLAQNRGSKLVLRLANIEAQTAIDAMMITPPRDSTDADSHGAEAARLKRGWKLPFCAEIISAWLEWISSWLDEQPESAQIDEGTIYDLMNEIHKAALAAVGFLIDWKDRGCSEQDMLEADPELVVSIAHMLGRWLATDPKLHQAAIPVLAIDFAPILKEYMRPCVSFALETCGIEEAQFIHDLELRELHHERKPAHEFASPWVGTVDFDDLAYAVYGLQSDDEGIWWVDAIFGKCLYTSWDVASAILGAVSVALWLLALLPQVYINWQSKSTAGLCKKLVVLWLAGDTMSLLGCMALHQQPFQIFLCSYFVFTDAVLLAQYFWYCNYNSDIKPMQAVAMPGTNEMESMLAHERLTARADAKIYGAVAPAPSLTADSQALAVASTGKKQVWQCPSIRAVALALPLVLFLWFVQSIRTELLSVNLEPLGLFMAWGSTVNYHLSRLPQLWHNYRRKSVDGLSLGMFAIIFIANGTYAMSLLALVPVSGPEFLHRSASYIYGPIGSMVLDVFILLQFFTLGRHKSLQMAKKAKSRTILVRLISSAGTGFTYVKQRPRTAAYRLTMMKFDPHVNKHVLFVENKMK